MTRNEIAEQVHALYWKRNVNCARATLFCLGDIFHVELHPQVWQAAVGMHGAGLFRAQCGLVEGALLFMGIHYAGHGVPDKDIVTVCRRFAEAFTGRFSSLLCRDLRPGGFTKSDPPHMCEPLTVDAIDFTAGFLRNRAPAQVCTGPLPSQMPRTPQPSPAS